MNRSQHRKHLLPEPGVSLTTAQRDHVAPRSWVSSFTMLHAHSVLNSWGQAYHMHKYACACEPGLQKQPRGHVRKPSQSRLCPKLTSCCVSYSTVFFRFVSPCSMEAILGSAIFLQPLPSAHLQDVHAPIFLVRN